MKRLNLQLLTGIFVMLGLAAFSYQAVTIGGGNFRQQPGYTLMARFDNISGLRPGGIIEAAGKLQRSGKLKYSSACHSSEK